MGLNLRKTAVGLLALGGVLGAFALYQKFNSVPPEVTDVVRALPEPTPEIDIPPGGGQIGTIGPVGVGRVRQTRFDHRNEHSPRIRPTSTTR